MSSGNGTSGRGTQLLVSVFGVLVSLLLGMLLTTADALRDDVGGVQTTVEQHGRDLATIREKVVNIERDHDRGVP